VWWHEKDVVSLAAFPHQSSWEGTLFSTMNTTVVIVDGFLEANSVAEKLQVIEKKYNGSSVDLLVHC